MKPRTSLQTDTIISDWVLSKSVLQSAYNIFKEVVDENCNIMNINPTKSTVEVERSNLDLSLGSESILNTHELEINCSFGCTLHAQGTLANIKLPYPLLVSMHTITFAIN